MGLRFQTEKGREMRAAKDRASRHHIGSRIFMQQMFLMAAVFLCVFLAFNVFFHQYIKNNVESQLDAISGTMASLSEDIDGDGDGPRGGTGRGHKTMSGNGYPNLSNVLDNKIRTEAKAFNADAGYGVTDHDDSDSLAEVEQIAAEMKQKNVSLSSAKYVYIKTDSDHQYYVSSINDPLLKDKYMVFFVDVTAIQSLADTINLILALILAAALAVSLMLARLLARTVTEPVKELSDFSEQLGSGDFSTRELHFNDIEFNELASSMNATAKKLDDYDKDQRAFFQNVSHELRTPLMSIRCYAEGITSGVMEAKKSGAVIITETDRLTELVEDLLYISRVDRAVASTEKMQQGDVRETVAMCATGLEAVAKKENIAIIYDFDEEAVEMPYNETHMYRAVSNLISNALRYAKTSVRLGCHSHDGHVYISVADDGAGIAAEDLPHIFERFYKGRGGKNGIGLAIVKSVVELHGGQISVKCENGTEFTMTF